MVTNQVLFYASYYSIDISQLQMLKAHRLSELNFLFILEVANIRCFILINYDVLNKKPGLKNLL
jgi:hypothetical protein